MEKYVQEQLDKHDYNALVQLQGILQQIDQGSLKGAPLEQVHELQRDIIKRIHEFLELNR